MTPLVRRESRTLMPDFGELFADFPSFVGWRPMFDASVIRVEESTQDGRYVLRAELPGIDPAEDVEVTVADGRLTIKAERTEKHEEKGRSEFHYGSLSRTVSLPAGADEEDIQASYAKGILTVTVGMAEAKKPDTKRIDVKPAD